MYPAPPDDSARVAPILQANANKNFVQRILNPKAYPVLPLNNGDYATHRMAWGETDGKYVAYPTVIYESNTKQLKQLEDDEAFKYAMRNNEYIPFKTSQEADWFSQNYKAVWGKNRQPK